MNRRRLSNTLAGTAEPLNSQLRAGIAKADPGLEEVFGVRGGRLPPLDGSAATATLEFRPMVMQGDVLLYANIIGKLIYNFSRKLNTLNTYFFL
jgi:hypothetical protein